MNRDTSNDDVAALLARLNVKDSASNVNQILTNGGKETSRIHSIMPSEAGFQPLGPPLHPPPLASIAQPGSDMFPNLPIPPPFFPMPGFPLPAQIIRPPSLVEQSADGKRHRKVGRSCSDPIPLSLIFGGSEEFNQLSLKAAANLCRYKSELCRPYEEYGQCKYGDKCQFAHGRHELRSMIRHPKYKTDLCKTYHTTGLCPYGPRCHFIHNDEERRLSELNKQLIDQQRARLVQLQQRQRQQLLLSAQLRELKRRMSMTGLGESGAANGVGNGVADAKSLLQSPIAIFTPLSTAEVTKLAEQNHSAETNILSVQNHPAIDPLNFSQATAVCAALMQNGAQSSAGADAANEQKSEALRSKAALALIAKKLQTNNLSQDEVNALINSFMCPAASSNSGQAEIKELNGYNSFGNTNFDSSFVGLSDTAENADLNWASCALDQRSSPIASQSQNLSCNWPIY